VALAAFAAGPVFLTAGGLTALTTTNAAIPVSAKALLIGPFALLAIPIGAALAAIPLVLAIALLGWLGVRNIAVRLPVFWGLTGAAMAGLPFLFVPGLDTANPVQAMFALTGLICALIARHGIVWIED
jgi:hypothetical protein